MTFRIPNMNATNAAGATIKRCMICGRPGDFHFPDGSVCAEHAVKAGLI